MNKNIFDAGAQIPTPGEIKNRIFNKVPLGYSPKAVDDFLAYLAILWDRALLSERELKEKNQQLQTELDKWKSKEGDLEKLKKDLLTEAETNRKETVRKAEELYAEVEKKAQEVRLKTVEWLEAVIEKVEETERQKKNFVTAFKSALDSHYALLSKETEEPESLVEKLQDFLKSSVETPSEGPALSV